MSGLLTTIDFNNLVYAGDAMSFTLQPACMPLVLYTVYLTSKMAATVVYV